MENKFQFYNTLTRKVETVIPHEERKPMRRLKHLQAIAMVWE